MATDVIYILKTVTRCLLPLECEGNIEAVTGIRENNVAMSATYRDKNHDHIFMANKSGTNGYYVRFDSGVQICWDRLVIGTKSMSSANANSVYGGMAANVTFPAAFISEPMIMCDTESNGYSNSQASSISSTSFVFRHWINYSNSSVTGITMHYIAIGRWY